MNQPTKIVLFVIFISFCWGISEEFATPAFYGVIALFLLSGLVMNLRANRREKDGYKKDTPDPGSIRRYYHAGRNCVEESATFEGYI